MRRRTTPNRKSLRSYKYMLDKEVDLSEAVWCWNRDRMTPLLR